MHIQVESHSAAILATIESDVSGFQSALFRFIFGSSNLASTAVLQSLLAVASLHRFGHRPQALRHKLSAIQLLNSSFKRGLGTKETIQHGAAGMLLASFEVSRRLRNLTVPMLMLDRFKTPFSHSATGFGTYVAAKGYLRQYVTIEWRGLMTALSWFSAGCTITKQWLVSVCGIGGTMAAIRGTLWLTRASLACFQVSVGLTTLK